MYSSNRANSIKSKDVKYIDAGIQENVLLQGVRFEKSPNGNNFIEFSFEKDGATGKHTEFEPSVRPGTENGEQILQEKCDKQFKRILDILKCFYKPEELEFTGANFAEFAAWVKEMLEKKIDLGVKLRVKFVYSDNGYVTLPKYATYTFIEPMILPEGQTSAIRKLGIDQFTRPIQEDSETANPNPFGQAMTTPHGLGETPMAQPTYTAPQQQFANVNPGTGLPF